MWMLISRRLRAYLLFALGAPLVAWLLDALGRRLEVRRGPTRLSNGLRWGGRKLRRKARGPLKHTGERPEQPATTPATTPSTGPDRADSDAARKITARGA